MGLYFPIRLGRCFEALAVAGADSIEPGPGRFAVALDFKPCMFSNEQKRQI